MVYQPKNPVGYKQLLTWQQSGQIFHKVKDFVNDYLINSTDKRLVNHLVDSARSVQRNIEEGYKRASTKEYVEFLGFSRGSLEELKGDFEELKREIKEGIREDKGWIRENKGWVRADKGMVRGDKGRIGEDKGGMLNEGEEMLTLIYGLDCMFGRQIKSLEAKMAREKTLPQSEMIKRSWAKGQSADNRFWKTVEKRFGLKKNEKGLMIKVDKENIGENKGK